MAEAPKKLFELEDWRRRILPGLVRECRKEMLKARRLGKRGLRVDRSALLDCVRTKVAEIKMKRIDEILGRL